MRVAIFSYLLQRNDTEFYELEAAYPRLTKLRNLHKRSNTVDFLLVAT